MGDEPSAPDHDRAATDLPAGAERPSQPDELLERLTETLLGAPPRLTPAATWEAAGTTEELARSLWLAMGFPHVPAGDPVLTERDLAALRQATTLLQRDDIDLGVLRAQARVMGQTLSTIASAQAENLVGDPEVAGDALPVLDELLVYLYHRHLLSAVQRVALTRERPGGGLPVGVVGFADLTDFTAAAAVSSSSELTDMVDRFVTRAADLVAEAGGRIVKLIGDEVMFRIEQAQPAAEVALQLVSGGGDIPPVHAGLALGPLVMHHGDVFGPTVNLASRLTDVARPGTVLVNDALTGALRTDDRYRLRRLRFLPLKGIGAVGAHALRRHVETPP